MPQSLEIRLGHNILSYLSIYKEERPSTKVNGTRFPFISQATHEMNGIYYFQNYDEEGEETVREKKYTINTLNLTQCCVHPGYPFSDDDDYYYYYYFLIIIIRYCKVRGSLLLFYIFYGYLQSGV